MKKYTFINTDLAVEHSLWYGTNDLSKIQKNISYKHQRDKIACPGITLTVGMPLAKEIQKLVLHYQNLFQEVLIETGLSDHLKPVFREDLSALHCTIYGLVKPDDYKNNKNAWSNLCSGPVQEKLEDIIQRYLPIELGISGWGIMGSGAIVLRLSDSDSLGQIRRDISESIAGVSAKNYTEKNNLNQIGIGRIMPITVFTETVKSGLEKIVTQGKMMNDIIEFQIGGEQLENNIWLVHYMHEWLTKTYDMIRLC